MEKAADTQSSVPRETRVAQRPSLLLMAWRHLTGAITQPADTVEPVGIVRWIIGRPRIFDLVNVWLQLRDYRRLATIQEAHAIDDAHHRHAHDYNAGVTARKVVTRSRRAEEMYRVLSLPTRKLAGEHLLVVGPRNVQELLIAWLHGFQWAKIDAIDLYTTDPKIQVMDMEAMTIPDASYHAVAMSNTLAYAKDTLAGRLAW
jgi:hypothetical protein